MTPLAVSVVFFVAAALGGLRLARAHGTGSPPPSVLVVLHPILAASGLLLLGAAYVRSDGATLLVLAFVLLVLAAAGGLTLARLRVRRGRAPGALLAAHAVVALAGIALLLVELLGGGSDTPPPI